MPSSSFAFKQINSIIFFLDNSNIIEFHIQLFFSTFTSKDLGIHLCMLSQLPYGMPRGLLIVPMEKLNEQCLAIINHQKSPFF